MTWFKWKIILLLLTKVRVMDFWNHLQSNLVMASHDTILVHSWRLFLLVIYFMLSLCHLACWSPLILFWFHSCLASILPSIVFHISLSTSLTPHCMSITYIFISLMPRSSSSSTILKLQMRLPSSPSPSCHCSGLWILWSSHSIGSRG